MTDPFAVPPAGAPAPPPLYGEPLRPSSRNGLGTAALVLACVSVPFGALLVLPLLAVVLGVLGMRRARAGEATNRGIALAGVVLGSLTLLFWAACVALTVWVVTSPAFDTYQACDDRAVTTEQHDACIEDFAEDLFGEQG